jgi:hypothetical protein
MRRILGGLGAGMILLAMAQDTQAQIQSPGMYQIYSPMTWGSQSLPMSYSFYARYPDYVAPPGFGPQNNAFTNQGLGSFVNGDTYAGPTSLYRAGGFSNPNGVVAPNNVVQAPLRARPLARIIRRRR